MNRRYLIFVPILLVLIAAILVWWFFLREESPIRPPNKLSIVPPSHAPLSVFHVDVSVNTNLLSRQILAHVPDPLATGTYSQNLPIVVTEDFEKMTRQAIADALAKQGAKMIDDKNPWLQPLLKALLGGDIPTVPSLLSAPFSSSSSEERFFAVNRYLPETSSRQLRYAINPADSSSDRDLTPVGWFPVPHLSLNPFNPLSPPLTPTIPFELPKADDVISATVGLVIQHQVQIDYWVRLRSLDIQAASTEKFAVTAEFEFKLKANYDVSSLGANVKINGITQCGYDGQLGEARMSMTLAIVLRQNGKLHVTTDPWQEPSFSSCDLTFLKVPVGTLLKIPSLKNSLNTLISNALQKIDDIDGGRLLDEGWNALSKPIRLRDDVWLSFNPRSLGVGDMKSRSSEGKSFLDSQLYVTSQPEIVIGNAPEVSVQSRPELTPVPASNAISIALRTTASLEELEKKLTSYFRTHQTQLYAINRAELFGSDGKLIVGLHFEKPLRVLIFLQGRPGYDDSSKAIVVNDLDYTVESIPLVERLDSSAHGLLKQALRTTVKTQTSWPTKYVEEVEKSLLDLSSVPLPTKNATIDGSMTLSTIAGYVTRDQVIVDVAASGRAHLSLVDF